MVQFAALFNEMTTAGAEEFAKFLNNASSSDTSQAGRWFSSATASQVKAAAALLNGGKLDDFREFIGIGKGFWGWLFGKRKQRAPAQVTVTAAVPLPGKPAIAVQAPQQPKADGDWQTLLAYFRDRRPAEISTVKEASAVPVIVRYHEAVVADPTCPKLTYYLLKTSNGVTGTFPLFPYLVVATGEKAEHDRAWNFRSGELPT